MRSAFLLSAAACSIFLSALAAQAQNVGVSAAVNQSARGIRPGSSVRTIVLGDNVIYNERIETDPVGLLQILLADGTTFTVGPNSALSIDRFVYDPAAGTAEVTASLTKGVFRFIGGKTSKTPGGVQLNTPVGTIGIRGAMADMKIGGGGGEFALRFGNRMTLDSGNGRPEQVYKAGFSIVASKNTDGSLNTGVRKTQPGFASEIQQSLSGAPGKTGGSSNPPTNGDVIASGIATENSNRPPLVNEPRFITIVQAESTPSGQADEATQIGSNDVARGTVVASVPTPGSDPTAVPDPTPIPTPTPRPDPIPPRAIRASVLTAGATYTTLNGDTIVDPGRDGLVGGSDETDVRVNLLQADGSGFASGTIPQGVLTLPIYADSSFTTRTIGFADGATLGGVPLSGLAYSGVDDFTAYTLAINGDRTNPVYALKGTPLDDLSVVLDGDVRTYAFTADFLQQIPVPFMRADSLGSDYQTASITPFYVAEEPGAASSTSSKLFQSWLLIENQGAAQRSAIGVNVGGFFESDGAYQTSFAHRGSYRASITSPPIAFTGGATSLGGPDGGNHFFGSNGEYLVLGNDLTINEVFSDISAYRGGGVDYGTLHVLSLTDETPSDQFAAASGATRALGTGSNTTINGFASAVIEGRDTNGGQFLFNGTSAADVAGVTIQFDRDALSLGGELEVGDSVTRTHIAFGDGINGNNRGGDSAFVNDDMFGAHQNRSESRNYIRDFNGNGSTLRTYPIVPDDRAKTYFVSGDAVPQTGLLPQGKMCDCAFLEWGWWGTQIHAQDPRATAGVENLRHGIHLGNWVAGDVTTAAELAGATSLTTATYQGHALGTVVTNDGTTVGRYVAAGDMGMTWNFGTASGTMAITNFDGRNLSSTDLAATNVAGSATFGGTLAEANISSGASGDVNGAFVNGASVAQGVIGNMSVSTPGQDWSAVGIIAGAR